jgi:FkbM family methyltransferase
MNPDQPDYPATVATISHEGQKFSFVHFDHRDHIFAFLRESGTFYESEFLVAMAGFLEPGALVLDVGANIGNHTIFLAGVCGCRVIAFEPNPEAAKVLRLNVAANDLGNRVRIEQMAVGAARQNGALLASQDHNLGTARITPDQSGDIEIVPLDEMTMEGKVSLIKIDVEGMDLAVLKGAVKLIEHDRPVIAIEIASADAYLEAMGLLDPFGHICTGSFNYTPTHIFAVPAEIDEVSLLRQLSHRLALQYIGNMTRHGDLNQRLIALQHRLAEAEETGKAGLAAPDPQQTTLKTKIDGLATALSEATAIIAQLERRIDALSSASEQDAGSGADGRGP